MIHGYIKGKTRKAEDRQIKSLIINALLNTEKIGKNTMDYRTLIQRVCEHMDVLRFTYTIQSVERCMDEMITEDTLYRVSTEKGYNVGRSVKI